MSALEANSERISLGLSPLTFETVAKVLDAK